MIYFPSKFEKLVLNLGAIRDPSKALILPKKYDLPEFAGFRENAIFVKNEIFQILA